MNNKEKVKREGIVCVYEMDRGLDVLDERRAALILSRLLLVVVLPYILRLCTAKSFPVHLSLPTCTRARNRTSTPQRLTGINPPISEELSGELVPPTRELIQL